MSQKIEMTNVEELHGLLEDHGIDSGALYPATRNIYYNENYTDGEKVFLKVSRSVDDSYWFTQEVLEASVAHRVLLGTVHTPLPLHGVPIPLKDGRLLSAWAYTQPGTPENSEEKTDKLLYVAKALKDHTQERVALTPKLMEAGWNHTATRAFDRLKSFPEQELEDNVREALRYIKASDAEKVWIHGDLHGANMIQGTDYLVDWDSSQLSFVEWDLAHIVKEPFHHIDHAHWPEGVREFEKLLEKVMVTFPKVDLELVRQSVLLRRSAAILWKKSTESFDLDRWYTTLRWFKAQKF